MIRQSGKSQWLCFTKLYDRDKMDTRIKNVFVYIYSLYSGVMAVYPKVNIFSDHYTTLEDDLDYENNICHIDINGILSNYLVFSSEGVVLTDTSTLTYTVWFKESNPKEAQRLIYEQLRKETEENIQDIERRLNREKQRLFNYEKKLAELN